MSDFNIGIMPAEEIILTLNDDNSYNFSIIEKEDIHLSMQEPEEISVALEGNAIIGIDAAEVYTKDEIENKLILKQDKNSYIDGGEF